MTGNKKSIVWGRFRRCILFLCLLVGMITVARNGTAATVSSDLAKQVAGNFLGHIRSAHTLGSVELLSRSGQSVAYLVNLSPRGYILVAGNTFRVPVKGYSLNSAFSDLPEAYAQNLLNELEIPVSTAKSTQTQDDDLNAPYWAFLTQPPAKTALDYTPDTFLLTTRWSQGYPYNKFNPTVDGSLTVTGCTQTAVAQVMRFHAHPAAGSGIFTWSWNDETLTAVMNRPFNWQAMPDVVNGSVPEYQQDEVAALMRDIGILNQAEFGVVSTSTSFRYNDFRRAFGYGPILRMDSENSNFFTTIKDEIDNLRPVLLSMPGHMTVADGYAADEAGNMIHVNLGWGGLYDDYYALDQTNIIGPYPYPPDHTIYYNISPCQGDECQPYAPTGGGNPPVIALIPADRVIDAATILRIEAHDPDGDPVTLTAASSCNALQAEMNGNLLTLTPVGGDVFCRVTVTAQAYDGSTTSVFKVLCLNEKIYLGTRFDINGEFANQSEVDEYTVYLDGDTIIRGDRGYDGQAFYMWGKNQSGGIVIGPDDNDPEDNYYEISKTLAPGLYTVSASLEDPLSGYYYPYDPDNPEDAAHSGYILSVTCDDLNYTVADLAASLGIGLTIPGDVTGDGDITLDDLILILQVLTNSDRTRSPVLTADVDGDGRIGMPEAIFAMQSVADLR